MKMNKKNMPDSDRENKIKDETEEIKSFVKKTELQNQVLEKSLKTLINDSKNKK